MYKFKIIIYFLFILCPLNLYSKGLVTINEDTPITLRVDPKVNSFFAQKIPSKVQMILENPEYFSQVDKLINIDSKMTYWVTHNILSQLKVDRDIAVDLKGVNRSVEAYIIRQDGKVELLNKRGPLQGIKNYLAIVNPYITSRERTKSQFSQFILKKGEKVQVLFKVSPNQKGLIKNFYVNYYDVNPYLEMRRFGIYIEGLLIGALLALAIFGWYSAFKNKDHTSIAYGVWILFALMSVGTFYVHDGQRIFEFFVGLEFTPSSISYMNWSELILYFFGFGQSMTYVIFARTFLNFKTRFPRLYKVTNFYLILYVICFSFSILVEHHQIPPHLYWLIPGGATFLILLCIYYAAFDSWKNGMQIAKFFMIAMIPYFLFRSLFLWGLTGLPSPLNALPDFGLGLFLKDSNTAQAFGVVSEALIMALAVVARSRWLQGELTKSANRQKELVESQNKILEDTVKKRTKELKKQHEELDEAHQIVLGSLNYASRLQKGQLPRSHRIKDRFLSFSVMWEPRDTIGGDLWWISSTRMDGDFVIGVADCTGHGVPGAILSLLVSSSFERIYSNDTKVKPSDALISLDYLVRTGLNQDSEDSESDDGCDAALVKVSYKEKKIEFSGAKIDLFRLSLNAKIERYNSTRISLGYREPPSSEPDTHQIKFVRGDIFVLVTDGFTDQIGKSGKKSYAYGYKKLEQVLKKNAGNKADNVVESLQKDLKKWQGKQKRRDDVTVLAFQML